jgi:hypothetical protein
MKSIKLGIIVLIFFMGANVLSFLGIDNAFFLYFILLISIIPFLSGFKGHKMIHKRKYEISILVLIAVMMLNRLRIGMLEDSIRNALTLFITPVLFMLLPLEMRNKNEYRIMKGITKILIVFYVVECSLAIVEFVFKFHLFGWVDTVFETNIVNLSQWDSFRSVALHGSPLTNALLVTILNAFFSISSIGNKYKFLLWFMGFLAVLACNARLAIFLNGFLFIYQVFKIVTAKHISISKKMVTYIGISFFVPVIVFLVIYKGWGDRLFKNELLDQYSGQVRLDVFSIFDYVSSSRLLLGNSMKSFESIRDLAGLLIIENFWVCLILLFGLVFVILLVVFYFKVMQKFLKAYSFADGLVVSAVFLLLASSNNSLFTQYIPLFLFLICLSVFRPGILKQLLPRKFIKY